MSQSKKILEALQAGDQLTQRDAINRWQCYRLGARIIELRKAAHDIITLWEDNENGGRHARYVLKPHQNIVLPPAYKQETLQRLL